MILSINVLLLTSSLGIVTKPLLLVHFQTKHILCNLNTEKKPKENGPRQIFYIVENLYNVLTIQVK